MDNSAAEGADEFVYLSGRVPQSLRAALRLQAIREERPAADLLQDAVRGMTSNHSLARAISDAAWRQLRTMLEYKAEWYGRDLIVVDRWFPSSKVCSACGALQDTMPLKVREWTCRCGATHDRDANAATNIRAAGLAALVCGDGVRPTGATASVGDRR